MFDGSKRSYQVLLLKYAVFMLSLEKCIFLWY